MAKQNAEAIAREFRRDQVIQMKLAGATERAIAVSLEVSPATVHKDVQYVLGKLAEKNEGKVAKIRQLQVARYERLLLPYWSDFVGQGDEQPSPTARTAALDRIMEIMGRLDSIQGIIPARPLIDTGGGDLNIDAHTEDNRSIHLKPQVLEIQADKMSEAMATLASAGMFDNGDAGDVIDAEGSPKGDVSDFALPEAPETV